ncbi:MAG: general secretion pathway protein GspB [Gammaproteobacteria bacterium]|nr:general secretion pathway protein GspB [Gammaproteobacteria bacterium]
MSYILDALKKSEQDRGNGSIPNVQTIHSSALNYHQEKRPLWPWILIVILIANVFLLIYFLKPETNIKNAAHDHSATTNNNASYQNRTAIENKSTPVPVAITAPVIQRPDNKIATTRSTPQVKAIVDIDELPANIRQQVPNMVFSAHVYSSSPIQRSLVINDRFMEEGSAVGQDLILVEITRSGAIFDFRDYRFSASVLSGWSTH